MQGWYRLQPYDRHDERDRRARLRAKVARDDCANTGACRAFDAIARREGSSTWATACEAYSALAME